MRRSQLSNSSIQVTKFLQQRKKSACKSESNNDDIADSFQLFASDYNDAISDFPRTIKKRERKV